MQEDFSNYKMRVNKNYNKHHIYSEVFSHILSLEREKKPKNNHYVTFITLIHLGAKKLSKRNKAM
jgi:hypothetical protein